MLDDMVAAWRLFRDAETGFWCDSLWLSDYQDPCGADNNFYSSAGTGMGLVSEAVMVELGKISTLFKTLHKAGSKLMQCMTV